MEVLMSLIRGTPSPQFDVDVNVDDVVINGLRGRLKQKLTEIQELLFEIDSVRSKRRYRGPKRIYENSNFMLVFLNLRQRELKAWRSQEYGKLLDEVTLYFRDKRRWPPEADSYLLSHYLTAPKKSALIPELTKLRGCPTTSRAIIGRYHRLRLCDETKTSKPQAGLHHRIRDARPPRQESRTIHRNSEL
jgi:hypothetical protein